MKIQIDTDNKTINIDSKVNIKELLDAIKTIFPNNWEEYNIEMNIKTVIEKEYIPSISIPHKGYPEPPFYPLTPQVWYSADTWQTLDWGRFTEWRCRCEKVSG